MWIYYLYAAVQLTKLYMNLVLEVGKKCMNFIIWQKNINVEPSPFFYYLI